MKNRSRSIVLFLACMFQLAACGGGGGGGGGSGNTADTTPPAVIFDAPVNGATGVSIQSSPSVTFSEAMDVTTLDQTTFTLKDSSNNPIPGNVRRTSQTAIFYPAVALSFSTTYVATITTGARDAAGNALAAEHSWTFSTEPAPVPAPAGLLAVPGDESITISWSYASDPSTTYSLYWGTSPGVTKNNGTKIALGQLVNSYLHTGLTGGTTYYYVLIQSVNGLESAASPEASATPPFSTSITKYAADGSFAWQRGVNGNVAGVALAALSDGSFYVTGNFSCTVTFGTGETNETTLDQPLCFTYGGAPVEMFVARYNADGSLSWAAQAQTSNSSWFREPKSLTVLSDGSVVIVGSYTGDVTFGPGETNETTLAGTGVSDVFVVRYDAVTGSLLWAKRAVVGSYLVGGDEARAVAALSDDSVVLTGSFFKVITFDPGLPGEVTLTTVASCLTNDFDIFVARYTSAGAVSWARRAGGCSWEEGLSITALPDDTTAITGRFMGAATFGPGEANETVLTADYSSYMTYDLFLASYGSTTGSLQWAASAQSHDVDDKGSGICTTATSSLDVTGSLGGTTTFGAGETNETTLTGSTAFIARYLASDGTLGWAAGIGGDFVPVAAAPAPQGAATIAGTLYTTATLGPGTPAATTVTTPYPDILLARYTAAGSLAWVKRVDRGRSIGRSVTVLSGGATLVLGTKAAP